MKKSQALKLTEMPLDELIAAANEARRNGVGTVIETCGIINAKSGACSEDCKFCAQSSHHSSNVASYPLKDIKAIKQAAGKAGSEGACRFGIVTSGNCLTESELGLIGTAVRTISHYGTISPCASLGAISQDDLVTLKKSGLERYHHNIETSENFYPNIVSTHNYKQRISTVNSAKEAGLEVCSGGILGMGESWQDRIDMAFLLKELDVDSVPLNFLVPIEGTPLENMPKMHPFDAIRTIALFRMVLPDKTIKVAAGRETVLKDYQALLYMAGANGMLVGGYLTTAGRPVREDLELIDEVKKEWNKQSALF